MKQNITIKYKIYLNKKQLKDINKKNTIKRGIGQAALLHGYETNKINKWKKKHPKPTELQLAQDLFPEELILGWQASYDIALENIRNILAIKYCNKKQKKLKMWYDVAIMKNKTTGKLYNHFNYDPTCTGYIPQTNKCSEEELYKKLRNKFLRIKKYGNNIIKIKLYDSVGNERFMCAA